MSKKELDNCKFLPYFEYLFLIFFLFYISISYDDGEKGCNVWDTTSEKIVININIICMEQPERLVQNRNGRFVCML
jgi:hypothetical protein